MNVVDTCTDSLSVHVSTILLSYKINANRVSHSGSSVNIVYSLYKSYANYYCIALI